MCAFTHLLHVRAELAVLGTVTVLPNPSAWCKQLSPLRLLRLHCKRMFLPLRPTLTAGATLSGRLPYDMPGSTCPSSCRMAACAKAACVYVTKP